MLRVVPGRLKTNLNVLSVYSLHNVKPFPITYENYSLWSLTLTQHLTQLLHFEPIERKPQKCLLWAKKCPIYLILGMARIFLKSSKKSI